MVVKSCPKPYTKHQSYTYSKAEINSNSSHELLTNSKKNAHFITNKILSLHIQNQHTHYQINESQFNYNISNFHRTFYITYDG